MKRKIKKIPLRNLIFMDIDHIKIGRRMFVIDMNKEFYAEYGQPAGYTNFLNNLENGIETVHVRELIEAPYAVIHQVVQNGEIIVRDNTELLYESYKASIEQNVQLREAARIYGLEYEIDIIIDDKYRESKIPKVNYEQLLSDKQLNKALFHEGGEHFKMEKYKGAIIREEDGKLIVKKKNGKKL